MSLTGLILGLINICIVVAVLLLIGYIVEMILSAIGVGVPAPVRKLFLIIVALIALYMIVALLLGVPSLRIIGHAWITAPCCLA